MNEIPALNRFPRMMQEYLTARLRENYEQNCLPAGLFDGKVPAYDDFLAERRRLMALRIKEWFEVLS